MASEEPYQLSPSLVFLPPGGMPQDLFRLADFQGVEEISSLFSYRLQLYSTDKNLAPDQLVGQPVAFGFTAFRNHRGVPTSERMFHGIVRQFEAAQEQHRGRIYHAEVVPTLWLLTLNRNCRVFQDKPLLEILRLVLQENGLTEFRTEHLKQPGSASTPLEYCVQFQESDFDFLSRLMEKAGVFYFFEHSANADRLHIADDPAAFLELDQPHLEFLNSPVSEIVLRDRGSDIILDWKHVYSLRTQSWVMTDYNYLKHFAGTAETPASLLSVTAGPSTQFKSVRKSPPEVFDFPGGYQDSKYGSQLAKARIDGERARSHVVRGTTTSTQLSVGRTFQVFGHPIDSENDHSFIVTSLCTGKSPLQNLPDFPALEFTCVPVDAVPRPPLKTPVPRIHGVQAAVVVGPKDSEIHTDEHGRIRIQFFWDREGVRDGSSSCWVRCAHSIAGKGWGSFTIPRIGQEVVVTFVNGDPDRPLVTGVVYNGEQLPPWKLPANQTQSGLRTMSSLKGTPESFNELRFEDRKDEEQIYFHAEKNFQRVVENDDSLRVGFERKDPGNQKVEVFNNRDMTVGCSDAKDGSQTVTIWKHHKRTVLKGDETITIEKGNRSLTVSSGDSLTEITKGDQKVRIAAGNRVVKVDKGNDLLTVGSGDLKIQVDGGSLEARAGRKILLQVGPSSLTIDQSGIVLKGTSIRIDGQAETSIQTLNCKIDGSAAVMVSGGIIKLN